MSRTSKKLRYRSKSQEIELIHRSDRVVPVADVIKTINHDLHKKTLRIICNNPDYSIEHGTIRNENGEEIETYALCKGKKVLKSFFDKNGNLVCGHIFLFADTAIKEEDVLIKVYESGKGEISEEELMAKTLERPESIEALLEVAKKRGYKEGWAAFQAAKHAETYQDFLHIAEVCGYKRGWAYHKWKDRENNKQEQVELDGFMTMWNNRQNAIKKPETSLLQA